MKKLSWFVTATALACCPLSASAALINTNELIAVVESTIVDLDMLAISVHQSHSSGTPATGSLNYSSSISASGWQGSLLGIYGGQSVDISYNGAINFIGGPTNQFLISYTSDWLFGGQIGSGSGGGVYNDPEFSFTIDLANLQVGGAISVSYGVASLTLEGLKDLDDEELTVSATLSAVDLPLIDASLASAELSFMLDQATGGYSSEISGSVFNAFELFNETLNEGILGADANGMVVISSTTLVPEPGTLALLALAISVLACLSRRYRWQAPTRVLLPSNLAVTTIKQ